MQSHASFLVHCSLGHQGSDTVNQPTSLTQLNQQNLTAPAQLQPAGVHSVTSAHLEYSLHLLFNIKLLLSFSQPLNLLEHTL